jgi:phospholipid transport system substrate-binding protein
VRSRRSAVTAAAVVVLVSLGTTPPARAESALQQLRTGVDRVFDALADPALDGKGDERREMVHRLNEDLFDWAEMSQRLLGPAWGERTETERARFAALLAHIVDAHVLALAPAGVDRIVWRDETVGNGRATIRTTVVPKRGQGLPVDYHMVLRDSRWRVYDVVMDGVSLLGNYRAQFRQIIKTSSYEALIHKLTQ